MTTSVSININTPSKGFRVYSIQDMEMNHLKLWSSAKSEFAWWPVRDVQNKWLWLQPVAHLRLTPGPVTQRDSYKSWTQHAFEQLTGKLR